VCRRTRRRMRGIRGGRERRRGQDIWIRKEDAGGEDRGCNEREGKSVSAAVENVPKCGVDEGEG
jgi:hypothetical protein